MYYSVSIMEIGTALGATCIILNFHHRNTKMPNWFHKIVLEWLAKLVWYKPRYLHCHLTSESEDETVQTKLQTNSGSERKRNDAFDLDRESIEFEMDLFDESRGGRDQVPLAQNGNLSVPANNGTRKRSIRRKTQDTETETSEVQFPETRFPFYDVNKEEIYKKQWQDAARILDRFLLVASFVIGSISAMSIFLQSPRIRGLFIPWQKAWTSCFETLSHNVLSDLVMKHILNVMVSVVALAMDPVGNVVSILNNRANSTYKRAKTKKLPEMFAQSKIKLPEIFALCLRTRSSFTQLYVDSCLNWKKYRCHVDNWTCYRIVYKLMKHYITPQTDEAMRPRQWITQFPGVSQNCTINIGGYWLKNLSGLINGKFSQSFTAFLFLVRGKGEMSPLKFLVSR